MPKLDALPLDAFAPPFLPFRVVPVQTAAAAEVVRERQASAAASDAMSVSEDENGVPRPVTGASWAKVSTARVGLSRLLVAFVREAHLALVDCVEQLEADLNSFQPDADRRRRLLTLLQARRERMVRLLVLVRWAGRGGGVSGDLERPSRAVALLARRELRVRAAVDGAKLVARQLEAMQRPAFDVFTALHVLTSGSYRLLPLCVEKAVPLDRRPTPRRVDETWRRLDDKLYARLAASRIPPAFRTVEVERGVATLTVPGEFVAGVSLRMLSARADDPPDEPESGRVHWCLLRLRFLIGGGSLVDEAQTAALLGRVNRAVFGHAHPLEELHRRVHGFCVRVVMDMMYAQCQLPRVTSRFAPGGAAVERRAGDEQVVLHYWRGVPAVPLPGEVDPAVRAASGGAAALQFVVDRDRAVRVRHDPPLPPGAELAVDLLRLSAADVVAAAVRAHAADRVRRMRDYLAALPPASRAFELLRMRRPDELLITLVGRAGVLLALDPRTGRFLVSWADAGRSAGGTPAEGAMDVDDDGDDGDDDGDGDDDESGNGEDDVRAVELTEESAALVRDAQEAINTLPQQAPIVLQTLRTHSVLRHFAGMALRLGLDPLRRPPLVWDTPEPPYVEGRCIYVRVRRHPNFLMAVELASAAGSSALNVRLCTVRVRRSSGLLHARTWRKHFFISLASVQHFMASSEVQRELDDASVRRRQERLAAGREPDELRDDIERRLLRQRLVRRRALASMRLSAAANAASGSGSGSGGGGAGLAASTSDGVCDWTLPKFAAALRLWESRLPLLCALQALERYGAQCQVTDHRGSESFSLVFRTPDLFGDPPSAAVVLVKLSAAASEWSAEVEHAAFEGLDDAVAAAGGRLPELRDRRVAVFHYAELNSATLSRMLGHLRSFAGLSAVAASVAGLARTALLPDCPAGFFRVRALSAERLVVAAAAGTPGERELVVSFRPDGRFELDFAGGGYPQAICIQAHFNSTRSARDLLVHTRLGHEAAPALAEFVRRVRGVEGDALGVRNADWPLTLVGMTPTRVRLEMRDMPQSRADLTMRGSGGVLQDFGRRPSVTAVSDLASYLSSWYSRVALDRQVLLYERVAAPRDATAGRWWNIEAAPLPGGGASRTLRLTFGGGVELGEGDRDALARYFDARVVSPPFSKAVLASFYRIINSTPAAAAREAAALMALELRGDAAGPDGDRVRMTLELPSRAAFFVDGSTGTEVVAATLRFCFRGGFEVLAPLAFDVSGRRAFVVSRQPGGGSTHALLHLDPAPDGLPYCAAVAEALLALSFDGLVATLAAAQKRQRLQQRQRAQRAQQLHQQAEQEQLA